MILKPKHIHLILIKVSILPILILVFSAFHLTGQVDDYAGNDPVLRVEDAIYKKGVRTPIVHVEGDRLSPPYIELGSSVPLRIRFDDLNMEFSDYYYTVFHCDANWEFSDLDQVDYITGFTENTFSDYEQSFNTIIDFVHYTATFPNDMMRLTLSGNYLLVVYENDDLEQLVFSKRIVVFENLVQINSNIHESSEVGERRYRQEVDFVINHPGYDIQNPYSDLQVAILQNNRWDHAITNLEPRFVKDRELEYDYTGDNAFPGLNEFRDFDLKSLNYISVQLDSTDRTRDGWHAWLKPDPNRGFLQYRNNPEINGRFLVRNDDGFDDHLESDYVYVHFTLPFDFAFPNAGVYVYGECSEWDCLRRFRLEYNYDTKAYETTILLKQGYYNYYYAVLKEGDSEPDLETLEGTHFETQNEYTILVYNYDIYGDYDRVVGLLRTDSFNR